MAMNKLVLLGAFLGVEARRYDTYGGGPTFEITYDSESSRFKF